MQRLKGGTIADKENVVRISRGKDRVRCSKLLDLLDGAVDLGEKLEVAYRARRSRLRQSLHYTLHDTVRYTLEEAEMQPAWARKYDATGNNDSIV